MFNRSSKINEFRTWGLLLTMAGMGTMVLGTAGVVFLGGAIGKFIAGIFLVIGMIVLLGSVAVYFWAGMMSTSATVIECPECSKPTKMIGMTDRCMFCNTILSYDPRYAPEDAAPSGTDAAEAAPPSKS
ncbi:DUF2614 family zinc ribbon-containing protein [Paenibacillus thermoaerophilus]|uniref:DUF2614 family zinc ribbon-containing protein n=1 Tax=Paenibacillus thermoaerophilus TaxID=1215385 RepID=A0ABW2V4C3_9BACL|nr:DUF2614 family zinc ribbon-containing protein [Paenibacillus thermoaerophilus]TMV16098.1 hypothetical protein FE781_08480 [Paenibacillus thermoaerophilus]